MRSRQVRTVLLLVALALPAACAFREDLELSAAKALISPEQAKQIGEQVKAELQKQGVQFVQDAAVDGWVGRLAGPLLDVARKARPDVKDWQVHVIDDPKTVNAFATTGGDLYVYSGLVLLADDGGEIAGVLAHEIGHVALRHVERQLVDAFGLQAIAALALGKNPGAAAQVAAAIGGKGLMLANSRADEKQADDWGVIHADRAGYDPHGLVRFFQKLEAQEGKTPQALGWLSDHPSTPSRVADVESVIRKKGLHAAGEGPSGLEGVKTRLRQLPPPKRGSPAGR